MCDVRVCMRACVTGLVWAGSCVSVEGRVGMPGIVYFSVIELFDLLVHMGVRREWTPLHCLRTHAHSFGVLLFHAYVHTHTHTRTPTHTHTRVLSLSISTDCQAVGLEGGSAAALVHDRHRGRGGPEPRLQGMVLCFPKGDGWGGGGGCACVFLRGLEEREGVRVCF